MLASGSPAPLPKVFDFFCDAANLDAITPPWLGFRIVTPTPILMNAGTVIDYRISLHGIRLSWRTVIESFEPPHRFIDRQVRGPYQLWVHEHRFREDRGGTTIEDSVTYAPPLRPLGLRTGSPRLLCAPPASVHIGPSSACPRVAVRWFP